MQETLKIIKDEETKIMKNISGDVDKLNLSESEDARVQKALKEITEKYNIKPPERVEVTNKVEVPFPEVQKITGIVKLADIVKATITNLPDILKVSGRVKADVEFPSEQVVKGTVNANVKFPTLQKIFGKVKVDFPETQKIEGKVKADVKFPEVQKVDTGMPVSRGTTLGKGEADPSVYIPVRLTDGRRFYDVMSQSVSSNGKLSAAIERLIVTVTSESDQAVISKSLQVTDADGAQTDTELVPAIAGTVIKVKKLSVLADGANGVNVACRIGFGASATPAVDAEQVLFFHPGIVAGSGVVEGGGRGVIGQSATDEALRVTCDDPTSGSINIIVTYVRETIV